VAFVRHVRLFVHLAADAVPAVVGEDAVARFARERTDRVADVAELRPRLTGRDRRVGRARWCRSASGHQGLLCPQRKLIAASPCQPFTCAPKSMLTRSPSARQ